MLIKYLGKCNIIKFVSLDVMDSEGTFVYCY